MQIQPLKAEDAASALRLSTQAGWNQTLADWRRSIDLCCDLAFGGWMDNHLIATATVARYETLGWVGMVLVDLNHRGGGFGRRIFQHATVEAARAGIQTLGLDATDLGRPVYQKQGFVDHSQINRWMGTVKPIPATDCTRMAAGDLDAVCELDRKSTGINRRRLFESLLPGGIVVEGGFGFIRAGRTAAQIGPVIADSQEAAKSVIQGLLAQEAVGQTVLIDVPASIDFGLEGFSIQRRLMRMSKPAIVGDLLTGAQVHAGAGFEWG